MATALRTRILSRLRTRGPVRGSDADFASAFACTEAEAHDCLGSLVRDGRLIRATALPGARSVYTYNPSPRTTKPRRAR